MALHMGKWGDFTLLLGVVTPVITGSGPPCRNPIEHVYIPTIAAFKSYGAHFYTSFICFFNGPNKHPQSFGSRIVCSGVVHV